MPGVARRCGNLRNMCRDPIYKLREAEDPEDRVGESVFQFEVNGFCHLCKMLHEKRHKTTHWAVSDLHQAFYGPEDLRCLY